MSRLTKKETNTLSSYGYRTCEYLLNGTPRVKALNKLGKLEDLEDELGCPLEIVSKILLAKIDEIIVNYGDGGYGSPYTEYIPASVSNNIYHDIRKGIVIETNICEIPLKDYGVNWWLKGEKSE